MIAGLEGVNGSGSEIPWPRAKEPKKTESLLLLADGTVGQELIMRPPAMPHPDIAHADIAITVPSEDRNFDVSLVLVQPAGTERKCERFRLQIGVSRPPGQQSWPGVGTAAILLHHLDRFVESRVTVEGVHAPLGRTIFTALRSGKILSAEQIIDRLIIPGPDGRLVIAQDVQLVAFFGRSDGQSDCRFKGIDAGFEGCGVSLAGFDELVELSLPNLGHLVGHGRKGETDEHGDQSDC